MVGLYLIKDGVKNISLKTFNFLIFEFAIVLFKNAFEIESSDL